MILNGKAKEKFLEYVSLNNLFTIEDREKYFNSLSELFQNALIIDWFDSVGIIINIVNQDLQRWFYNEIKTTERIQGFNLVRTRQQATIQAIKKANDIYNERFK